MSAQPHHTHPANESEYHDVKTLLAWDAPGRPFKKRSKEYYANILLIMLALEVLLFLFSQYVLMIVVVALVFLSYALSAVPPHPLHYKITSEGVMVEDIFYIWQELYDFYFKPIDGEEVLHIRTKAYIPGELAIMLGTVHKDHLKSLLLPYLPYREYVKPSFTEKSGEWLSQTFPLERPVPPHHQS